MLEVPAAFAALAIAGFCWLLSSKGEPSFEKLQQSLAPMSQTTAIQIETEE